jgi:hypothetical protein
MQEWQKTLTMLWSLWRARNDQRFNNKTWSVSQVIHATSADINTITKFHMENRNSEQHRHPQMSVPAEQHLQHQPGVQVHVDGAMQPVDQRHGSRKAGRGIHIQGDIQGRQTELLI